MQTIIRAIYPPQCVSCHALTESEHGLCATCWRDTRFIHDAVCETCGVPMMGAAPGETDLQCDDCLTIARPWRQGRAALVYDGIGRRLVLGLKHGDRTDLVKPAARWMAQAARQAGMIGPDTRLLPMPLHWRRLLTRRYNQAALLAQAIAALTGASYIPDALERRKPTQPLDGHSRDARFAAMAGAITPQPRRRRLIAGQPVVIVDDVMTSGASLAAATEAAQRAGAGPVCVLTLARVVKET